MGKTWEAEGKRLGSSEIRDLECVLTTENLETDEPEPARFLRSGGLVVDRQSLTATLDGERLPIRPKPTQVLAALMARAGDVVSKDELVSLVWEGRAVSDDAVSTAIRDVRRALGEDASTPHFVATEPKRGYRFLLPVQSVDDAGRTVPQGDMADGSEVKRPRTSGSRALLLGIGVVVLTGAGAWFAFEPREETGQSALAAPVAVAPRSDDAAARQDAASLERRISGLISRSTLGEASARFAPEGDDWSLTMALPGAAPVEIARVDAARLADPAVDIPRSIAAAVSPVARCAAQLTGDAREMGTAADIAQPVMRLCSRVHQGALSAPTEISSALLEDDPESHFTRSLHALMLALEPPRFNNGEAQTANRTRRYDAADLAAAVLQSDPGNGLAEAALLLARSKGGGLSEQEQFLRPVDNARWENQFVNLRTADFYRQTGRLAEAEYVLRRILKSWPAQLTATANLALIRSQRYGGAAGVQVIRGARPVLFGGAGLSGLQGQIVAMSERGPDFDPSAVPGPAPNPCFAGFMNVKGREEIPALLAGDCAPIDVTIRARMAALYGYEDEALALLDQISTESAQRISVVLFYPEFSPLWQEERFWSILQRKGLVDYWRMSGARPDMCGRAAVRPYCAANI